MPDLSQAQRFATLGEAVMARARCGLLDVEVYDPVKGGAAISWDAVIAGDDSAGFNYT